MIFFFLHIGLTKHKNIIYLTYDMIVYVFLLNFDNSDLTIRKSEENNNNWHYAISKDNIILLFLF